jgi:hypothetical protein
MGRFLLSVGQCPIFILQVVHRSLILISLYLFFLQVEWHLLNPSSIYSLDTSLYSSIIWPFDVSDWSNTVSSSGSIDPTGLKDVNVIAFIVLCFLCMVLFFLLVSFGFCCSILFYFPLSTPLPFSQSLFSGFYLLCSLDPSCVSTSYFLPFPSFPWSCALICSVFLVCSRGCD